jgi:hypothetical protein
LVELNGHLHNCCELLPDGQVQYKLFPDEAELKAGVLPETDQKVFDLSQKRFKVVICSDIRQMDKITTEDLDFLAFIYHFTESNFPRVMPLVKSVSKKRKIPILVSSLVSDQNSGFSSFVDEETVVSLPRHEGFLEIEI